MKSLWIVVLSTYMWSYGLTTLAAQPFSSGSNGSFGEINIVQDTALNLPPDGIFHATTITVAAGAMLTFNRNALNTPVYLLATGDVIIEGTIVVSGALGTVAMGGRGGPGGFDGGAPRIGDAPPGDGFGPGAGLVDLDASGEPGAAGAYGGAASSVGGGTPGTTYGSPLIVPLVGGSGGAGGGNGPGAGGGGAVLLSSDTSVHIGETGRILSRGGDVASGRGDGSGGAIRIVTPRISGTGDLDVFSFQGGHGRIRLDLIDRSDLSLFYNPGTAVSIGALLAVFPDNIPRLDIIAAAGQTIEGATGPVEILLPFNTSPNQTVTVQAQGFTGIVPINVVLTPDSGNRRVIPAEVDMSTGNSATVTVDVVFPINIRTHVHVWTR